MAVRIAAGIKLKDSEHHRLLKYLEDRLLYADSHRKSRIAKYNPIDTEINTYLKLDKDDQKRKRDSETGKGVKTYKTSLPMAITQLDEAVTFLLSVLAPDSGIYGAIAPKEKQDIAKAFSALMNKHADKFKHYPELAKFFFNALKYNSAAMLCEWENIQGTKIRIRTSGARETEPTTLFSGNKLTCLDMYNFLYDHSVPFTRLAELGEFAAIVELKTDFRIQKLAAEGGIFDPLPASSAGSRFFEQKPIVSQNAVVSSSWLNILSMNTGAHSIPSGSELVHVYIWLPKKLKLPQVQDIALWRITIQNMQKIVNAIQITNAHEMLPFGTVSPWDDDFDIQTKSFGELLLPFQRFSSAQMNIHQDSARKKLYGLTFYNQNIIPLLDVSDPVSAQIPVNPVDPQFDLRKAVLQLNDAPDTENTLSDIQAMDGLMQKVLPTDTLKQVADLQRATQYQAAATVQSANRRNLKIAKVIDAQALSQLRFMQMYNIFEFQEPMELLNPDGTQTQINPGDFVDAELEFSIDAGLRGLDRLSLIATLKDIINSVIQSQIAIQQVDILALLDYMTSLMGEKVDFKSFEFKSAIDALSPQEKEVAFQLFQQAQQQQQTTSNTSNG